MTSTITIFNFFIKFDISVIEICGMLKLFSHLGINELTISIGIQKNLFFSLKIY